MLNILSLSFGHDGLAAVFKEGRFVAAIATERLTRVKKARGVNLDVIRHVLNQAGMSWTDIHLVVITNWFYDRGQDGRELFDKAAARVSVTKNDGQPLTVEEHRKLYSSPLPLKGIFNFSIGEWRAPCLLLDHHFSHCAYAYYMSPFDDALVFSVDGFDNLGNCHSVHFFDDGMKKDIVLRRGGDFEVGGYYTCICDCLGFYPGLTDAGKVMALAAYGKPLADFESLCWGRMQPSADVLNGDILVHTLIRHGVRNLPVTWNFQPALKGEGGVADPNWLDKNDWRNELNRNIAATAQAVLETSIRTFIQRLAETAGALSRNLCLSGGTMLNCVNNGKILHSKLFDRMFVAPACGDEGLAIGAGLWAADHFEVGGQNTLAQRTAPRIRYSFREAFEGGRRYSMAEIQGSLDRWAEPLRQAGVAVRKLAAPEVVGFAADRIIADRIVGWFYRGSEMGPRALGHRSLLANPCNKDMKDILNRQVKHREEFRPFAPVVLLEHAEEWFELGGNPSPFMLYSVRCRKPDQIPSAVHIDGTARVQTVDSENNGRFHELVARLHEKTGVPIVLNTSFNVQGEPIVESPDDAIRCFLGTKIDALVLEEFALEKSLPRGA